MKRSVELAGATAVTAIAFGGGGFAASHELNAPSNQPSFPVVRGEMYPQKGDIRGIASTGPNGGWSFPAEGVSITQSEQQIGKSVNLRAGKVTLTLPVTKMTNGETYTFPTTNRDQTLDVPVDKNGTLGDPFFHQSNNPPQK